MVTKTGKSDDDGNSHARRLTPVDRTDSTIGAPLFETTSMLRAQRRSVEQPQRSKERDLFGTSRERDETLNPAHTFEREAQRDPFFLCPSNAGVSAADGTPPRSR